MAWTAEQQRAMKWYCDKENLTVQLSAWPIAYFKHRETGKEVKRHISPLVQEYHESKKRKRAGA